MSWQVWEVFVRSNGSSSLYLFRQIHYNQGADLLTYLVDPLVFAVKNGYVEALQGMLLLEQVRLMVLIPLYRSWFGYRDQQSSCQRSGRETRCREGMAERGLDRT